MFPAGRGSALAPLESGPLHAGMPLVSVLMVFHRDTPFLRPAIASVLGQTLRDLELVLVDNGTGLTPAALGDAGQDPRLTWVRLPANVGIPGGHNAGVQAARGEFVALLDYDDLARPQRLERQVAALRADPRLGLVSALAERIDAEGRSLGRVFCLPDSAGHRAYAQFAAPVVTPAATVRREVLEALPYRAEFPFAADLDFQARLSERWPMAVLPEVLLDYRWYADQTTQQRGTSIEQSRAAIQLAAARRRAGRPEDLTGILQALAAPTAAESWRRVASLCLAEGYGLPAAYGARRSFALERTGRALLDAMRLGAQAWRQAAPSERMLVARMFLTGPLRALGLRPA
jgi:hypothetical protein